MQTIVAVMSVVVEKRSPSSLSTRFCTISANT